MEINTPEEFTDRFSAKIEVTYFANDIDEARDELKRLLELLFQDENVIQVYGDVLKNAEELAGKYV